MSGCTAVGFGAALELNLCAKLRVAARYLEGENDCYYQHKQCKEESSRMRRYI